MMIIFSYYRVNDIDDFVFIRSFVSNNFDRWECVEFDPEYFLF